MPQGGAVGAVPFPLMIEYCWVTMLQPPPLKEGSGPDVLGGITICPGGELSPGWMWVCNCAKCACCAASCSSA